jgi:ligand-binding sensor domain-containing protein
LDGTLVVLSTHGAFTIDDNARFEPVTRELTESGSLSGDHITGLATDDGGRLWAGYFDGGIDLIDLRTDDRLFHLDDERVRQVNYLLFDAGSGEILAATSRGLVSIGGGAKALSAVTSVWTRESMGLVSDSVAHISLSNGAKVLATAGGLTAVSGGRARSVTAFHGLASNHLYSSAFVGSRLFVGSLAGLVELDGLRVIHTYKTSNSQLSHDWVTALCGVEGTLYIGTNGGGVDSLLPTGEWISFESEVGKFEVNQNAMHYDGRRLYVGTTDRGLLVYGTQNRRWLRKSAGLSSNNVTSLASDDRFVYAGTMNGLTRIEKRVFE